MKAEKKELSREEWESKMKLTLLLSAVAFGLAFLLIDGTVHELSSKVGLVLGIEGRYIFLVLGICIIVYGLVISIRLFYINFKIYRS